MERNRSRDGWPRAIERKRRRKVSEVALSQVLLESEVELAMWLEKVDQHW